MAYLAPIHRPSSVRHAIKLSFLAPNSDDLVVAKANRLEIYSPNPAQPDQLQLLYTRSIYGRVTLLQKLRPAKSETDHLFIGTDRYHYFTVSWDASTKQLSTGRRYHDIAEKTVRDSQWGDRVHVDPTNRFLTLECFEGTITVVPIANAAGKGKRKADLNEIGELGDPIPVRVNELFVKSSCFVHKRIPGTKLPNPEIALLWEDPSTKKPRLRIHQLIYTPSLRPQEELGSVELLGNGREATGQLELGVSHLIPLPPPIYGMLVVGETSISYVDEWDYKITDTRPLDEATVFVAWCAIDEQRYVLADDYGKLYLLFIQQNFGESYAGHKLDVLGETSRASTLAYLDGGRIYVGSHQGDSQIIQIREGGLDVVQTFPNIAPILDFTVMDMGNRSSDAPVNEFSSGQARIVTGSGAFKDGSLRSVRSGVGLEDLGSIGEMGEPVSSIFSLRDSASGFDNVLVISFVAHTRVFLFSPAGEVEEADEFKGFAMGESTLYASTLPDGRAIQVTSSGIVVADVDEDVVTNTWQPSGEASITAVAADGPTLLVSLGGAALLVLDVMESDIRVRAQREFDSTEQVSCITIAATIPDTCVAGFWKDSKVSFLNLRTLEPVATERVAEDDSLAVPRSLIVANILPNQPPTLFVGLADGNVVTYSIESSQKFFTARKSIILGTQQANFALLPRGDGLQNVFAACEHPSLVYGSEGRMVYSAVTAENASSICSFNSEAYPNAIAIAAADELKLGLVDEERTTHVQTLPIYETVRRIAYSPELKAFGLGTIKRTLSAGEELVESHFKLVDEVAFQELHSYRLNDDELIESCIRCKLDDGFGNLDERFVVGTAFLDDSTPATAKGRLLVFEVTESRELKLVADHALKGACRCLGVVQGHIVAALIKTVVIYSFEYEGPSRPFLVKKAAYRTATAPIDLCITDDIIAVTDLMKSTSLVQYRPGRAGQADILKEIGRHFETLWGTAVANVDSKAWLEADAEGNLIVLQHNVDRVSEDEQRRLEVTSEMLLGEMVNRIRRIDVQPTPGAAVIPRAFLATVEGSIYLFALIAPDKQDLLIRMQTKMAELLQSPGDIPFAKFRGFKTQVRDEGEMGPKRFVDGELIERFLDCSQEVQEEILKELPGGMDVESMRALVESLKRIH